MSALSFGERVVREAWRLIPQRAVSELIGWGGRSSIPPFLRTTVIGAFARKYGIDVDEAEKPIEAYQGVEDFFTRKLRPGARPMPTDPSVVVSSADGTVVQSGRVQAGQMLEAKDRGFELQRLLCDDAAARQLDGGDYLITYLSPRDYHRVHTPVPGRVMAWHHIPGELFPVNDGSLRREPQLFARNERFVTLVDGPAGLCAVVMVAAIGVGHITAAYDEGVATHRFGHAAGTVRSRRFTEGPLLARGDELGTFHLGSTTVVIFEPGRVTLDALASGQTIRMGQAIGRAGGSRVERTQ